MMRFAWKSPPEYFLCRVVRSHAERAFMRPCRRYLENPLLFCNGPGGCQDPLHSRDSGFVLLSGVGALAAT